ncbi:MAG: TolC family protein [Acidobacteria bacterium]|nr:TolC family protein [Acidobacteriota bacterium]
MKVCSASLRRVVASGLILAFTILPLPSAMAQGNASSTDGLPPLPLSPIEKAREDGTALPLSLVELTKLVLQNNLDIAIQDTNEELRRLSLLQTYGSYDPTLTGSFSTSSNRSVSTSAFDTSAAGTTTRDSLSMRLTYRQTMKTGGTLSSTLSAYDRTATNSNSSTLNPNYSNNLQFQYQQPLWRNLRVDNTRNQIKLANLDIELNDVQFKQSVTRTIADVQSRYWDLVSAIRNYEIQRNSVTLAQMNLRDNRRRLEVGTIPPIDVTTAEAQVSSRELSLISAEDQILQTQNNLRQLVSSDRNSDIWKKVIVPTDTPDFREYKIDADTAVSIALQNRPEMEQSRISVTRLDLQNRLSRESKKWGVDLTASFQMSGSAGQINPNSDPNRPNFTKPSMIGGFPTGYKVMFSEPNTNWSVGLNITVPMKNRQLDAQLATQEINKRQELMRRRQQEQSIQVEVLNALQSLESSRRQVAAAEIALRQAREQLDGEEKRFEAGLSQNYRVLEVQQQLSNQEYSELQALIRYKQAIITLQRVMNNLLEASEFSVARGSSMNVPPLY